MSTMEIFLFWFLLLGGVGIGVAALLLGGMDDIDNDW